MLLLVRLDNVVKLTQRPFVCYKISCYEMSNTDLLPNSVDSRFNQSIKFGNTLLMCLTFHNNGKRNVCQFYVAISAAGELQNSTHSHSDTCDVYYSYRFSFVLHRQKTDCEYCLWQVICFQVTLFCMKNKVNCSR